MRMKPKLYDFLIVSGGFFISICLLFFTLNINKLIPSQNKNKEDEFMELIENLNDRDINNKLFSIVSLGYLRDYRAEVPLFKLLDDPDLNIRWKTYVALSRIGSAHAIEVVKNSIAKEGQAFWGVLANSIANSSYEHCKKLEKDLIAIGIPIKEPLKKMLESQDPLVKMVVTETLDRISVENKDLRKGEQ